MTKLLMVDYEKCVGCRTCEIACSMGHEGAINPARSRIGVVKWEMPGKGIPMTCAHCEQAPCQAICPVGAISRCDSSGVTIDYDLCIGCRMCAAVCPFGAINFDSIGKRVSKCDLCDGDPLCAKFCAYGALQYVEASRQTLTKQRQAADRLRELANAGRHHGV
ncbi:MAG TPA: 4Fe-4S dicluster domain-containing protein [Anaerolineae bacterium]|nr:4Fe-4S dicluster domain-containing protein [Anaerolineae bacterium]